MEPFESGDDSPFDAHGIKYLSPSSLNTFRENPAYWVLRYLMKEKDEPSPDMIRGRAVEAGWTAWLYKRDRDFAEYEALRTFDFALGDEGIEPDLPEVAQERGYIIPMLDEAIKAASDMPVPLAHQVRVELWIDDLAVPIIGYVDIAFADTLIDLKATLACPSAIRSGHARQVALYARARSQVPQILYVTPKKHALYTMSEEEIADAIQSLTRDAFALQHFLGRIESPEDALQMLPINEDNYYWSQRTLNAAYARLPMSSSALLEK